MYLTAEEISPSKKEDAETSQNRRLGTTGTYVRVGVGGDLCRIVASFGDLFRAIDSFGGFCCVGRPLYVEPASERNDADAGM